VLVPETLLKKRKVNDKAREEKLAKAIEARKVSSTQPFLAETHSFPLPTVTMMSNIYTQIAER
jgi:hypothetical protein